MHKKQLLLGGKNTLKEALRPTLGGLEVVKLTVGFSITLWKMSNTALWRSQTLPK
jgi:hypothetical protein